MLTRREVFNVRVRDPVHGFIHLSGAEVRLINHPVFQRLRNIRQLSLTHYVYPGAVHSRFEHSLGVAELATQMFEVIETKQRGLLDEAFQRLGLDRDAALHALRLAALLHDIGHLPFSHSGETMLPAGESHEHLTVQVVTDSEVAQLIRDAYGEELHRLLCTLLGAAPPELQILKKILKGELDADRTDYLIRDSLHCGVDYGVFDYRRLLETLDAHADRGSPPELAIERGGVHTLEALLLARYFMFSQVYFHRTRRIYDIYLSRYFPHWKIRYDFSRGSGSLLLYDDVDVLKDIRDDSKGSPLAECREYATRIARRFHHTCVLETTHHASASDARKARQVFATLQAEFKDFDFILDEDARARVHRLYTEDPMEEMIDDLTVLDPQKRPRWIRQESLLLKEIPKEFWQIRIYADHKRDFHQEPLDLNKDRDKLQGIAATAADRFGATR